MNRKDFELLVKLMQLCHSDNDHEALMALRKANALLDRAGINWDRLLQYASVGSQLQPARPGGTPSPSQMDMERVWRSIFQRGTAGSAAGVNVKWTFTR